MAFRRQTQVLVVGAGPVGLFTALCMAEKGLAVQIIDKEWRGSIHSYALALHPRTLRLLDGLGVARELIDQGHRIERLAFYVGQDRMASLDFTALDGEFPFVVVLPQSALEHALEKQLKNHKIKVLWNHQAQGLEQDDSGVTAKVARMEKYSMGYPVARTEWVITKEMETRADFVVGADGYHSLVRKVVGSAFTHHGDAEAFAVFEFPSSIEFEREARVVFHTGSTNVIWPLGRDRARWSFQVERGSASDLNTEKLRELAGARAPWFESRIDEVHWSTTALFERRLVERFGTGRIWLLGDAAHITGPVGVQSMNVGLSEAHELAECVSSVLEGGAGPDALDGFEARRQADWRKLLAVGGGLAARKGAPAWPAETLARVLPCIPASGDELERLLEQLGLGWGA